MQLGVIGLGRMGQIVVDRTLEAGHDVVAFDLDEAAVATAADAGATPADSVVDLAERLGDEKRVWLMVPAGDAVDAALDDLEPHLDGAAVLTIQNGLGNIETIREYVAPHSVVGGTTTAGATLEEPGTVRLSNRGQTRIGRPWSDSKGSVSDVANTLRAAGYETEVVEAVQRAIWEKVLVNVGINPVTALGRVRNGALRSGPGRELMNGAIEEAAAVARGEGYDVDAPVDRALDVVAATAENRSSMLRDVETGNKTEIEALNGAIVDRAAAHGLDTPINETLLAAVQLATGDRAE